MTPNEQKLQQCVEAMKLLYSNSSDSFRFSNESNLVMEAYTAARELLDKHGAPLTTADKLTRVADVMEACGVEFMSASEPTPIKICGDEVRIYTGPYRFWVTPADLRRAAEECK